MWRLIVTSLALGKVFVNAQSSPDSGYITAFSNCPMACQGSLPDAWTAYHNLDRITACNESMLLDLNYHNALTDPATQVTIRACTPAGGKSSKSAAASCAPAVQKKATFSLASWGSGMSGREAQTIDVASQIQQFFSNEASCDKGITSIFGYASGVAVGAYVGPQLLKSGAASTLIQDFITSIQQGGIASRKLVQYCGADADFYLGVVADTTGSLPNVQDVVKSWSQATCVNGSDHATDLPDKVIWTAANNRTSPLALSQRSLLLPRADCSTVKVASGDSCSSLAKKCNISPADFTKYNKNGAICSSLTPGQYVCCSPGTLPDRSPKPGSDGVCAHYTAKSGDYCAEIAASYSITVPKIESFNTKTWGWAGCNNLQVGQTFCLSTGSPPMPASVQNAVCGPQVVGTKRPANDSLASLNPCPLNACCDIWGQCGTTSEFCTPSKSSTGAPGTAAPGKNGCISNCGTDIVNNGQKPTKFMRVGYFESWNQQRPCLNMDITDLDTSQFTHVHFAFANITKDYNVEIKAVQDQFDKFKGLTGIKRILSFGGWSFSTSQDSYPIFRQGVTDAQRQTFATNVVNFIKANNLDGVDFDWEYPGAPDIPGIPPGSPNDGPNYLKFLKLVRSALPSGKTLSIAAPASFWYLKGFPISDIAKVTDYIIYMTYDLHGQWDYNNKWATPGCPGVSCLRSHVNYTETINSLSMITKAGVPTYKIIVGVTSYGRSFKMGKAGCSGPTCPFTGPASGATPGECTQTAGYISDAEIQDIIDATGSQPHYDAASGSSILVHNSDQWVSYMDNTTLLSRTSTYQAKNFGGTSLWAVDLASYVTHDPVQLLPCNLDPNTIDDIKNAPIYCVNGYIIIVLQKTLSKALSDYNSILASGYDDKFKTYSDYTKDEIPAQLEAYMAAHGNDHFSCTEHVYQTCCADCSSAQACSGGCTNCPKGSSGYIDKPVTCPSSIPQIGDSFEAPPEITYTLKDKDAFFKDVGNNYGIDPAWVQFADLLVWVNGGCQAPSPDCEVNWHGFPVPIKGYPDSIQIPNPKDTIGKALGNFTTLGNMLADASFAVKYNTWPDDASDVVDGASLPVFMAVQAVASMQAVVKEAGEIAEEQRKEMILGFVTAILFIIPGIGDAIGAEIAALGRIIQLANISGNIAFTIYGVVEDPKSAIFALFGALLGAKDFGGAAKIRRGITEDGLNAFGPSVKGSMDSITSKIASCI